MTPFLRLLPAGLAVLLLGAHFFRARLLPGVAAALVLLALLFVPRAWAARAVQAGLALGALEWLRTAWVFAAARRAQGAPHLRLWLILGAVAAFTALAAWLLGARIRRLAAREAKTAA
ncbi:MAG: hypothetical protein F9K18_15330 [Thermoanaerobaculia bacterium]|nr:MAG: hypothetical protein F9K18_15330 [Thermoanaerobaculia bacterium]